MNLLKILRQQISKRRTPPHKCKVYEVPKCDYDLLKVIRLAQAAGQATTIMPLNELTGEDDKSWQDHNAKILHEYYNMNSHEVLTATGFWVEGKR